MISVKWAQQSTEGDRELRTFQNSQEPVPALILRVVYIAPRALHPARNFCYEGHLEARGVTRLVHASIGKYGGVVMAERGVP